MQHKHPSNFKEIESLIVMTVESSFQAEQEFMILQNKSLDCMIFSLKNGNTQQFRTIRKQ
jgi:hypothetical protein